MESATYSPLDKTISIPLHPYTTMIIKIVLKANNSCTSGIGIVPQANVHQGQDSFHPFPSLNHPQNESIFNRKNNAAGIKMVLASKFPPIPYGFN